LQSQIFSFLSKKLSQWVGFNAVGNKNSLSFGIDVGFKFSKLPWTLFAVADFWKEIGEMSKADALAQLEKFFYQGHAFQVVIGCQHSHQNHLRQLPAAINFAHYTHGTGQVHLSLIEIHCSGCHSPN
jgi:hypothetical protein